MQLSIARGRMEAATLPAESSGAVPIVKAPRARTLDLFLPQGADAGAFLGDLQVTADRVGADHVRVRVAGLSLFERGHLGGGVVLVGVIGDMQVGNGLSHVVAAWLSGRCLGLGVHRWMTAL